MNYPILFFLLFISNDSLFATPLCREFDVENGSLTYYVESPIATHPLLIIIEGSYVDTIGPQTVLRLHHNLSKQFLESGIGLVSIERRGVKGKEINHTLFHQFNTPSQRLSDHIRCVEHLRNNPPPKWNGTLLLMGGSEGGPIAIKLAYNVHPSACIAIVGCNDGTFKEYIWNILQLLQLQYPEWQRPFLSWWYDLPFDRQAYEKQCEKMKQDPNPQKSWFGQTFLYWADALDQTEYREFLELKCPVLVIAGSEDSECLSTERLIKVAKQNHQDVTYLCIQGMAHDALNPKWNVIHEVLNFIKQKGLLTDLTAR